MNIAETLEEIYSNTYEFINIVFQTIYDLIEKYFIDNPMFRIVLAFVPALLGIAYPLIIQTISRLNDQYKSTHIIEQFKNEIRHKFFIWNLRVSVFLTILCFVLSPGVFLLAFISVIILLVSFFLYLQLLLKYQNGKDLFEWYLKRFNIDFYIEHREKKKRIKREKRKILKYWHAIIDIFLFSIRNNDRKLEYDIRDFYIYKVFNFIKFSDQKDIENVLFPSELYNSTFDIIYTYIKSGERDYYQNIEIFVGSIYFSESFGKLTPHYFHQDTLTAIWRNLVLLVEHERGDKIVNYWRASHQYFRFNLDIPRTEYDDNIKETEASIEKRNKIIKYRDAFIQLHTVLGAYLMYKRDCKTLNEIWFFTQSQPPVYVLLPQTPGSIFNYFFKFLNYEFYNADIIIRFWFKNLGFDEMNNKRDVKFIVCEYLGLLFLRLYITSGFYGNHPLSIFPQIPIEQTEKKKWEENLSVFRRIIESHLNDVELMNCLGLSNITKERCAENNLRFPLDYIDELKQKVEEGFEKTLEESELDKEKIDKLDQNTVDSIKKAFQNISRIKGQEVKKENRDYISISMEVIRGTRMLLSKEAFIANTSMHHLNADSIVGEVINNQYYHHFASKISLQNKKRRYEVPNGQIFSAIEKLNPSPDEYIILSFGLNIKYLKDYKNVEIDVPTDNEDYRFKSIPIYCYDFGFSPVYNTIYLISKNDLPMIKHSDWSEIDNLPANSQEHWRNMTLIDDELKIYRKISDLNTNKTIRDEYLGQGKKAEELKNMIEVDVDFLGYIWFRNDVKLIEIKESELFQEGGAKDNIEEIKPLE
jgi:hypothetical protein